MGWWFRKKAKVPEFCTHELPGDVGTVSLPSTLVVDFEDDGRTLVAWPQNEESITLRFSSISFVPKNEGELSAKSSVEQEARLKGYDYLELGESGICSYESEVEEQDTKLTIKFWQIGAKNTIVVFTATIVAALRESSIVEQTLQHVPEILKRISITKLHRIIESDGMKVETTTEALDPWPQQVTPFGEMENAWLAKNIREAMSLSGKYGSGGVLDPENLDCVFSRWMREEGSKETEEVVADALGAAFGDFLAENHGFRWVAVTDQYGTEYAVRHEIGDTTAFPRASVQKRIERRDTDFFRGITLTILDQLRRRGESQ